MLIDYDFRPPRYPASLSATFSNWRQRIRHLPKAALAEEYSVNLHVE